MKVHLWSRAGSSGNQAFRKIARSNKMVLWLLSSLRVGGIEDIGLLCMHQGREREGGGAQLHPFR